MLNLESLKRLLSEPTAPFKEHLVKNALRGELKNHSVPFFEDPIGNILVGVKNKAEYLKLISVKSKDPVRLFIAHMDHPGFHGVEFTSPMLLRVKWHGGSPTLHLEGAPVWVCDDQGRKGSGKLTEIKLASHGRAMDEALVLMDSDWVHSRAKHLFGAFLFRKPVWQEGNLLYTKAADDLVGAFAIVETAKKLFKSQKHPPFIGLLSRAEEVGFIGTLGHLELGWLKRAKRPLLGVSIETSRTLPGAEIGKGPIVRLGDRFTVFDAPSLRVLTELAERVLPGAYQRRIMDAGSCEASATTAYGIASIGISIPLGNYHNESFQGGPDSAGENGPAPEFVHTQDIEGLLKLTNALCEPKLSWQNPWKATQANYRSNLKKYLPLLKLNVPGTPKQ